MNISVIGNTNFIHLINIPPPLHSGLFSPTTTKEEVCQLLPSACIRQLRATVFYVPNSSWAGKPEQHLQSSLPYRSCQAFTILYPRILTAFSNNVAPGPSTRVCEKSDIQQQTSWPGLLPRKLPRNLRRFLRICLVTIGDVLVFMTGTHAREIDFIYVWRTGKVPPNTPHPTLPTSPSVRQMHRWDTFLILV